MFKIKSLIILFIFFKVTSFVAQEKIEFTPEELQWIKEHPVVHFGFDPNWPPFEIYENGKYSGILADYLSHIEKHTGIKMKPVEIHSYKETLDKLHTGEIHVAPEVGKNSVRERYLEFTEPYLTDPQVIVTRVDASFVKGLIDLSYKTVSQPEGYTRIKRLKAINPNIKIITTSDVEESLEIVSNGDADAFVGSLSVVSYYINNLGYKNLKIASSVELGDINFRLATTKSWVLFRDISQKVFKSISQKERRIIRNNWIAIRYDHGIDKQEVLSYVLYASLVIIVLFSMFYFWNKTLKKEIKRRKAIENQLRQTLGIVKEKNKEKDTLLKEIHHRVKNNLQMIQSLFNMQSRKVDNEYTLKILAQGKTRIQAISLVHQLLYQSENFDKINIQDYILALEVSVNSIYKVESKEISISVNAQNIYFNIDQAIPLGLIINELLVNSFKYAFLDRSHGRIDISIKQELGNYIFYYKDNGVGIKVSNLDTSKSLGMRLITRLSSQLGAKPIFNNDKGLSIELKFPQINS